jgi:hypothetical protein
MSIKTLTLYDVPPEVRAQGATLARQQIRQALRSPFLTKQQREELQGQLQWVGKWEHLQVGDVLPKPSA